MKALSGFSVSRNRRNAMYVLHAQLGFESRTRRFTTFQSAAMYARRCAALGWIVKALTLEGAR
jgi:hypothetical protein